MNARAKMWVAAARPRTLPAAIAPVVVGTACAHAARSIAWGPALAACGGAIAIQIGANFANDAFDGERGVDDAERIGPVRAVGSGLVSAATMKRAMAIAFAIAMAFGVYLTAVAGLGVVAIGLVSIAAGIAYTGGPWPLGYHGLGDVFVLLFFGFVAVCGTAYVQLGSVPPLAVAAAVPVGALATAILVVNNVRDRAGDARAGKRTLAVRFGRGAAIAEYVLLVAAAFAVPLALAIVRGAPACAAPLVLVPVAVRRIRGVAHAVSGPEYNAELAATAKLLLVHAVLFAAGLAW
jgi:1,4-dihydroxy-2-naphthoate polyprenyltransferase